MTQEELEQALHDVTTSNVFASFQTEVPDNMLAHFFGIVTVTNKEDSELLWEIGFYSPEHNQITVFSTQPVKKSITDKPFGEQPDVRTLKLEEVNIPFEKAVKHMNEYCAKEFVSKKMFILQNEKGTVVWNMTYITENFLLINCKMNATTGEEISKERSSILGDLGHRVQ
ncbi:MAG: hypothetical protein H6502_00740 [Candidatus Woesearchaeota archaeon]|nr:MAG: hypothetical protein H6502_00740 [Candidatus Woesearchaeota archaeon]